MLENVQTSACRVTYHLFGEIQLVTCLLATIATSNEMLYIAVVAASALSFNQFHNVFILWSNNLLAITGLLLVLIFSMQVLFGSEALHFGAHLYSNTSFGVHI